MGNSPNLKILVIVSLFTSHLAVAQTKEGFYDNNNYDLRNLPSSDPESNVMPDVTQPPQFEKPPLATPKNARTQYSGFESIPGAGALLNSGRLPTSGNNTNPQGNPLLNPQNSLINPLTGEINEQAVQRSLQKSRLKQENNKKKKEEFDEEAVYEESKFRRGYIIFFLTLPFAVGASSVAVALLPAAMQKAALGSAVLLVGSIGLSGTNVYLDQKRLEEHREKKKQLADTKP
ncbi:MAG: hypothetical protein O9301_00385 [Leptospira sp.]|nr:hypothetical protein [Leptospira sp.]